MRAFFTSVPGSSFHLHWYHWRSHSYTDVGLWHIFQTFLFLCCSPTPQVALHLEMKKIYLLHSNQAKKEKREQTSWLKSHPLQSPQWVTLQSLTFLSLWKISRFHINQIQRLFSLSYVRAKTQAAEKTRRPFFAPFSVSFFYAGGQMSQRHDRCWGSCYYETNYEED